jgi:hypothetical protein
MPTFGRQTETWETVDEVLKLVRAPKGLTMALFSFEMEMNGRCKDPQDRKIRTTHEPGIKSCGPSSRCGSPHQHTRKY